MKAKVMDGYAGLGYQLDDSTIVDAGGSESLLSYGDDMERAATRANDGDDPQGEIFEVKFVYHDQDNPDNQPIFMAAVCAYSYNATEEQYEWEIVRVLYSSNENNAPVVFSGQGNYIRMLSIASHEQYSDAEAGGWVRSDLDFTYGGERSINIVGSDVADMFPTGLKIRVNNPTLKYFYVEGSAVIISETEIITVINLVSPRGYPHALQNAAISEVHTSGDVLVDGFANIFPYKPDLGGMNADDNDIDFEFSIQGGILRIEGHISITSNTSFDSSNASLTISLPEEFTPNPSLGQTRPLGQATYRDSSTGVLYVGTVVRDVFGVPQCRVNTANSTYAQLNAVNQSSPVTWANGDLINVVLTVNI